MRWKEKQRRTMTMSYNRYLDIRKDFKKLNNFFWFFSLDLKSSKETTQSIILNWINKNEKFDENIWEFNITAKRIIAWLSNHQLTYEDSNEEYRLFFNHMLQKQTNHLLNEIKNLKKYPRYSAVDVINESEARALEPGIDFNNQNIVFSRADGAIDTIHAINLMIENIKFNGGSVLYPCRFQGLNYTNRILSSVETTVGELLSLIHI